MFKAPAPPRQDDWIDKLVDYGIPLSSAGVLGVIGGIYGGPSGAVAGAKTGYNAGTSTAGLVSGLTGKGHAQDSAGNDKFLTGASAALGSGEGLMGAIDSKQSGATPQTQSDWDLGGQTVKQPSQVGFLGNMMTRANTIRSLDSGQAPAQAYTPSSYWRNLQDEAQKRKTIPSL